MVKGDGCTWMGLVAASEGGVRHVIWVDVEDTGVHGESLIYTRLLAGMGEKPVPRV